MRIAIAGVVTKKIEEDALGGTEAFTYLLVKGLVQRGHEVTLYCATGSKTPAQHHIEICNGEDALGEESNLHFVYPYTLLEVRAIIEDIREKKFDILHINFLKTFIMSYFASQVNIPILYTMHRDFMSRPKIYEVYERIGFSPNENFVYVSKKAQELSLFKNNAGFIYNGIDVFKFPISQNSNQEKFLWLSRVDELKGCSEAVKACSMAKVPLILSGIIDRAKYQSFFDKEVKPYLTSEIVFEEHAGFERKLELYQDAKAFLFPIQWEEPFGLVLIEAMACGTPVIAFARGAIPEVVVDGVTGFVVNSSEEDKRGDFIIKKTGIEGLVEAIQRLNSLSEEEYVRMRQACRKHVEDNFSVEKMVDGYERVYREILNIV
ncbi:MAG: glycosyltransferase family 4 protein [Candidatus Levybacteria bacterium]|nr:glycosyltransferase family 4 protein [Candidatus Levybacteria bacterium]